MPKALSAIDGSSRPAKTLRREFLQLIEDFEPGKSKIAGWLLSEKLDGGRCFWDGGVSRGQSTTDVPWAGILDPDSIDSKTTDLTPAQRKTKIKPIATGLWSRYGNPIMAPGWFLDQLPPIMLDGELYAGRKNFQVTMSAIRKDVPVDGEWRKIRYAVYSQPEPENIFQTGLIKNPNMLAFIDRDVCETYFYNRGVNNLVHRIAGGLGFWHELRFLEDYLKGPDGSGVVYLHPQEWLPENEDEAVARLDQAMAVTLAFGGEGVVVRDPHAAWIPKRHRGLLRCKPWLDSEATVIGFVAGKAGKNENRLGHIGALLVRWTDPEGDVKEFKIGSGLTNETARLYDVSHKWATNNPGKECREQWSGNHFFFLGRTIQFKYREVTKDGIPKEGRYWRVRDEAAA